MFYAHDVISRVFERITAIVYTISQRHIDIKHAVEAALSQIASPYVIASNVRVLCHILRVFGVLGVLGVI
jgi:hypothetical protein